MDRVTHNLKADGFADALDYRSHVVDWLSINRPNDPSLVALQGGVAFKDGMSPRRTESARTDESTALASRQASERPAGASGSTFVDQFPP